MKLHTRTACSMVPVIMLTILLIIVLLLANQAIHPSFVAFIPFLIIFFFAGVLGTVNGYFLNFVNLNKPHRAVLVKTDDGYYRVELCKFPFWTYVGGSCYSGHSEERALQEYEVEKCSQQGKLQKKLESGPIRVLAEPSGPKISSASDAYKHIESILEQYAPEKVEAIRKLKEVFDKKD